MNSERYTMLLSETDGKRDKRDSSTVGREIGILHLSGLRIGVGDIYSAIGDIKSQLLFQ